MFSRKLVTQRRCRLVADEMSADEWRPWRITAGLESTVSRVLEFAMHLKRGTADAKRHATAVAKDAAL